MLKVQKKEVKKNISKVQKKEVKSSLDKVVEKVHQQVDLPKSDIKKVINESLKAIKDLLAKKEDVKFVGYFSFSTREQLAKKMKMRFGKDKGKVIQIPAKTVPTFKFSNALKKRIVK